MYHPNAFKNFYEAFDPDKNVEWAATMLKSLYAKFGTWELLLVIIIHIESQKEKIFSKGL